MFFYFIMSNTREYEYGNCPPYYSKKPHTTFRISINYLTLLTKVFVSNEMTYFIDAQIWNFFGILLNNKLPISLGSNF